MHDLFNPRIPPENLMSGRFRVHAVKSDTMDPRSAAAATMRFWRL